jgi:hypothetical protein
MQRSQMISENPLVHVRAMQKLAFPFYESGAASEQYLCSQMLEGFSPHRIKSLFIRYQGAKEIVYVSLDDLVRNFFIRSILMLVGLIKCLNLDSNNSSLFFRILVRVLGNKLVVLRGLFQSSMSLMCRRGS